MSKRNLLAGEAAMTCQVLDEAARKLLQWADLVKAAGNVDLVPAEHLRELGHALARQGGRLEMAREMSRPKRRGASS